MCIVHIVYTAHMYILSCMYSYMYSKHNTTTTLVSLSLLVLVDKPITRSLYWPRIRVWEVRGQVPGTIRGEVRTNKYRGLKLGKGTQREWRAGVSAPRTRNRRPDGSSRGPQRSTAPLAGVITLITGSLFCIHTITRDVASVGQGKR